MQIHVSADDEPQAVEIQQDFFHLNQETDNHSTLAFGNLEYQKDFTCRYHLPEKEGDLGKTLYNLAPKAGEEPSEFSVVFFGEICPVRFRHYIVGQRKESLPRNSRESQGTCYSD